MRPYEHGGDIYNGQTVRLDFSANVNPLGMPPAAERALREGTAADVRYPDARCRALRAALSEKHSVTPEQVLCGAGAADLIFRICAALQPRQVLAPVPTFSEYGRSAALFGAEIAKYPLREENGFELDRSFPAALTPETDMVFLCNPNNPTGRLCDPGIVAALADACEENGTYLVVDECFLEFTRGVSALPLLQTHPRLLVLRAFTKFYAMAGLRLGYLLCADAALLERIGTFGAEWAVSTAAQRSGLAALTEPDWRDRTLQLVEAQRRSLAVSLAALGVAVYPGEANFLLCRAPRPVAESLAEQGILVRRCGNFEGLDDCFFRVGVRTAAENAVLIDALREVLHG
ncbi:MAG: aminotransferase class I/II-fold pyridoxal phosphate-dependent enzyme [Ruminococcaceae bacterium]|nr:aminotransferase class I/II-fold pyridoxal phosphate-dependent enzyme [Oscillospiraceae bacterium]